VSHFTGRIRATHGHVGPANDGIGNLRVERRDAHKLDGRCKARQHSAYDDEYKVAVGDGRRRKVGDQRHGDDGKAKAPPHGHEPRFEGLLAFRPLGGEVAKDELEREVDEDG
jgi:hypothetical protein